MSSISFFTLPTSRRQVDLVDDRDDLVVVLDRL